MFVDNPVWVRRRHVLRRRWGERKPYLTHGEDERWKEINLVRVMWCPERLHNLSVSHDRPHAELTTLLAF